MTAPRLIVGLLLALFAAFWLWFGGRGEPLTAEEAESYLARIQAGAGDKQAGFEPELLASLRELVASDDGDEFYMLNLMRFRERAVYPEGHDYDDDVQAAADRYGRAVVPELLKRGSLPILVANVQGRFIAPDGSDDWDQVGIVRYRSRRDMLEMALALATDGGGVHKWASIEKTHVFPVKRVVDLVFVRGFVGGVLAVLGALLLFALRLRSPAARTEESA